MRELALFAGVGGGILGGYLLGWRTVAAVEIEEYPRAVLLQRQFDGILPRFPIWDDVRTFDGGPWQGWVDVISGGFPCQDISAAGKGEGITGSRSGLWSEMARVIGEVRPEFVFVENSPVLTSRGLDIVLSDLASLGYDAEWGVVGAYHASAPHYRKRIWILANANSKRLARGCTQEEEDKYSFKPLLFQHWPPGPRAQHTIPRMVNGVPHEVDMLKAIGNGQVPIVVVLAWCILYERLMGERYK
jgi:DNA (cytosine-5)-methyltransferase 1